LGIAQLMRERVVHRLWIRSQDPHWSRLCAFYEQLPEIVDAASCQGDFTEAGDSRAMAVISVQGVHPNRFEELIERENVSLWIAAGLGPEEAVLADTLAALCPGSLLVVSASDLDAYFESLAGEFGGIQFAAAGETPADRLRQAAIAQMMRKLSRNEQLVEFERSMQGAAVTQAALGQSAIREALACPVAEVLPRADHASRLLEIATRLLPSPEAYLYWGRALRDAARRLSGLRAARLYRQAAEKIRLAGRFNVNDQAQFEEWAGCMRHLQNSTPREAGRAVLAEVDREYQWRVAHGAALTSEALVDWAQVLLEWSVITLGEESRKLFLLARTRMDEAKRRTAELEPLHLRWAEMLCTRAQNLDAAEAERLLMEALDQVAGTATPAASLLRARCYFQLAALPGGAVQERVTLGDESVREALATGALPNQATAEWGRLYVELATARARQRQPDSAGYLAYGQNLYAQAGDYRGWSSSLLAQTRNSALLGQSKKQILETAREHALEAESQLEGCAAFDLARLAAALRDEEACRGWLKKACQCGTVPALAPLLEDSEFAPYRQKPWFREVTGV